MRLHRPRGKLAPNRLVSAAFATAAIFVTAFHPITILDAQTPPAVEEPDWANPDRNEPVTLDEDLAEPEPGVEETSAVPLPTPAPIPPRPPARPSDPLTSSSRIDQDGAIQDMQQTMFEPVLDDPDFGVPSGDNWYLPGLTGAGDPFFQMEGLKMRIGEVHLRLSLSTSFEYNDNIFQDNTPRVGDYITRVTPLLLVGVGDFREKIENYFSFAYSPQPEFFAENSDLNTVNEFLTGSGQYAFSRLVTSIDFDYSRDSNPTEDQSGIGERTKYAVIWGNSYALGAKTFLEGALSGQHQDLSNSIDYTTVSASMSLAYAYSPKTRFSFGPSAGITYVDGGGEQPFQGLTLGFKHDTLKKFAFGGNVGVQARQFQGSNPSGQTDYVTPTLSLNANYDINQNSNISLSLARVVQNSGVVRGQSVITNRAQMQYKQRLFGKFVFSLSLVYDILQYQGTGTNNRTDTYFTGTPSLGYEFWGGDCTVSLFYTRRQRTSEIESREFYSNTFGTRFQFKF